MTTFFQSDQIEIRRAKQKSGLRYGYSATGTVHDVDLQPIEAERIDLVGGRLGKTYEAWVDSSVDIKEGDQVKVVDTTVIYSVKAVSTYQGAMLLDHKHLILVAQD